MSRQIDKLNVQMTRCLYRQDECREGWKDTKDGIVGNGLTLRRSNGSTRDVTSVNRERGQKYKSVTKRVVTRRNKGGDTEVSLV